MLETKNDCVGVRPTVFVFFKWST